MPSATASHSASPSANTADLLARLRHVLGRLQEATGLPASTRASILWELAIAYDLLASGWTPPKDDPAGDEQRDLLPGFFEEISAPDLNDDLLLELRALDAAWSAHLGRPARAA